MHPPFRDYIVPTVGSGAPRHLIIKIPRGWEEPGETTTQIISEQHTGGAIQKKGQREWMTEGRSAG